MRKIIALLAASLGLLAAAPKINLPLPDAVKSNGVLKIGVKCDYPPFGFVDAGGKNEGYDVDLGRELATLAFGKPDAAQFQCVSSANRIPYLTTQRVDLVIATLGYNQDRARVIRFSRPYFSSSGRLLVLKAGGIKTTSDVAGKTVLLIKGTPYIQWFTQCLPSANRVEYDTTSEAISALKDGRGQAYVDDDTLLMGLAARDPTMGVVGSTYSSVWGIGTRLDNEPLTNWVSAAVAQLQGTDYFWNEFKRWVPDKNLQDIFSKAMPRPGNDLRYPEGPVVHC